MTVSKYQTRATQERRQPRMVPVNRNMADIVIGKDAQTPMLRESYSWWLDVPRDKWEAAQAHRASRGWGKYSNVAVGSMTIGDNPPRPHKSQSAFAPSPTRNSIDREP